MKSAPPGKSGVSFANNMKIRIILFCLFCLPIAAFSQEEEQPVIISDDEEVPVVVEEDYGSETYTNPASYGHPQVSMREVPADVWKKSEGGLNYSDDIPEAVKQRPVTEPRNSPNFNWNPKFWSGFAKVFSIIVLMILVGIVIYQMVQSPSNSAIRAGDGTPITFDNLDAYIQETDLERFLREALAMGNYNQAVRIYYLQVIKDLSQKEAIVWSREKTNRDYLREMRSHPLNADFRSATLTYEEVWYGNLALDRNIYEGIEGRMKYLLQRINGA